MKKNKTNFFVKILIRIINAINESNNEVVINDNELAIMKMLYYNNMEKLSTKDSILLFERVQTNFNNEMKKREIHAKNELEVINIYKEKFQLSFT